MEHLFADRLEYLLGDVRRSLVLQGIGDSIHYGYEEMSAITYLHPVHRSSSHSSCFGKFLGSSAMWRVLSVLLER